MEVMDRELVEQIRKTRRKEKHDEYVKKAATSMTIAKRTTKKEFTRQ
jgi:hypothetical protein